MEILGIIVLTALVMTIIIVASKTKSSPQDKASTYYDTLVERDKAARKMEQARENDRMDLLIDLEARKLFTRYKRYQEWEKATEGMEFYAKHTHGLRPDIYMWNPLSFAQIIYDEETMKFKDAKAEVLIRLEKLKDKYKKKNNSNKE